MVGRKGYGHSRCHGATSSDFAAARLPAAARHFRALQAAL
ncbi:hypothetical protein C725_2466 [Pacificimonas flava]|uniref:Uncharacterized protein n=1 Tax=Pacificimonas flava TaxID=1234595 RepID=M2S9X0_9SPHN|nr:hypothetical protein C725_2466 [Pacificimonas flava]